MIVFNFLKEYSVSIAVIVSLVGGLFKFWQYIDIKQRDLKQKRYENYHKLIERLNVPVGNYENTYLDIQKAVVFELRNFPEYKTVTKDILNSWIKRKTVLTEIMQDTLKELEK